MLHWYPVAPVTKSRVGRTARPLLDDFPAGTARVVLLYLSKIPAVPKPMQIARETIAWTGNTLRDFP